jgi:hypothetical protein
MGDTASCCSDWTQNWVAGPSESNDFSTDSIFLRGERECYERHAWQVGDGNDGSQEALLSDPELDVL